MGAGRGVRGRHRLIRPSGISTGSARLRAHDRLHDGIGLLAGGANVIMQLAMLPVGHGVVESRVESGRIDRHPIKRARTTLTYLAVATGGTDDDKRRLRRQVDRVHAQVKSGPGAAVPYDAFDAHLQLWVAACLYWGTEDVHQRLHGTLPAHQAEEFYRRGAAYGTTLQVPQELWPPDRAAFERYWRMRLEEISMDDATRGYLQRLARLDFLPFPLGRLFGPLNRFITLGFLPPEFRRELQLPWSPRQQRRFDRWLGAAAAVNRRMPTVLRQFPFNALLRDARRRIRRGRPLI